MDVKEIIEFLKDDGTYLSAKWPEQIETPFEIRPNEYLNFAEEDLQGKSSHHLINALSNGKRALDCQIESLLVAFGLFSIAKKEYWNIPKKIEIIKSVGILAPRVLSKINRVRNLTEHEFIKPDEEQVSDFIDVVALFIASTERFLLEFPNNSEFLNDSVGEFWINVELDYIENMVNIRIVYRDTGPMHLMGANG